MNTWTREQRTVLIKTLEGKTIRALAVFENKTFRMVLEDGSILTGSIKKYEEERLNNSKGVVLS